MTVTKEFSRLNREIGELTAEIKGISRTVQDNSNGVQLTREDLHKLQIKMSYLIEASHDLKKSIDADSIAQPMFASNFMHGVAWFVATIGAIVVAALKGFE